MSIPSQPQKIIDYCLPTLKNLPNAALGKALESAFRVESEAMETIEHCFRQLTGDFHSPEKLKYFFRSWMMTNNSAMCVSGLGNRMTLQHLDGTSIQDKSALFQALTSLHRISDEDLGVGSALLHWDLFYRMATSLCVTDDWQSTRYLTAEADSFKRWKDACSLKAPDLMTGLLTTLIHEIYTHGEVEYIDPLFHQWVAATSSFSEEERKRNLFWIAAHCNGTETAHFGHASDATKHYCRAHGISLEAYDMEGIFRDYLKRKARVMDSISQVLSFSPGGRMALQAPVAKAA